MENRNSQPVKLSGVKLEPKKVEPLFLTESITHLLDYQPVLECDYSAINDCITPNLALPSVTLNDVDERDLEFSIDTDISKWCPKANITYTWPESPDHDRTRLIHPAYTNGSDSESRTTLKLMSSDLAVVEPVDARVDPYSHESAQLRYLQSKPLCFLVLGKPGIGEYKLARDISDHWKCVYIDAEIVVNEEIQRKTKCGVCLEYSLKMGRTIHPDMIMRLIERKVRSLEIQQCGYVIAGIPIINSDLLEPKELPGMVTESAILTVEQTIHELLESTIITSALNKNLLKEQKAAEARDIKNSKKRVLIQSSNSEDEDSEVNKKEGDGEGDEDEEQDDENSDEEKHVKTKVTSVNDDDDALFSPTVFSSSIRFKKRSSGDISLAIKPSILFNTKACIQDQLKNLFNMSYKPDVIVYMMCPNDDVILKKMRADHTRDCEKDLEIETVFSPRDFDEASEEYSEETPMTSTTGELTTAKVGEKKEPGAEELGEGSDASTLAQKKNTPLIDLEKPHYTVITDINDPVNVHMQMERYCNYALPVIEKYMLVHDPQYIMKVDGRSSAPRMFDTIRSKLEMLPVQPVCLPEWFMEPKTVEPLGKPGTAKGVNDEEVEDDEEANEPDEDLEGEGDEENPFEGLSADEAMAVLCGMRKISPLYRWTKSHWNTMCPVTLKEGKAVAGDPQFAVNYMDKVFLLSSIENQTKFMENVRKYLLPPQPLPGGRVFVIGPKYCGKSIVANCISYLLNGIVIKFDDLVVQRKDKIIMDYVLQKNPNAISDACDSLYAEKMKEREPFEQARLYKVNSFKERNFNLIKRLYCWLIKCNKPKIATGDIVIIRLHFDRMQIPVYSDIKLCKKIMRDPDYFNSYIPYDYAEPVPLPEPVSPDDPAVFEFLKNSLNSTDNVPEFKNEMMHPVLTDIIKQVEEQKYEDSKGEIKFGGWVVDGVPLQRPLWEHLVDESCLADDIIILKDYNPDNEFLKHKLRAKTFKRFKDFKGLFTDLGEYKAAKRSPSVHTTASSLYDSMYNILNDIINSKSFDYYQNPDEPSREFVDADYDDLVNKLNVHLGQFEKDYEEIITYLEEIGVKPIIVNFSDLSDGDLLRETIRMLQLRYRLPAEEFGEEEMVEELANISKEIKYNKVSTEEPLVGGEDVKGEDDTVGLGEEEEVDDATKIDIYRWYGDTNKYCPVTYLENGVLWPGSDQYGCSFEGKVYLMSTEDNRLKFLENPTLYAPYTLPPKLIPALRICFCGPIGSGKTCFAKQLARNFGLYYVNFEEHINAVVHATPKFGTAYKKWFIETDDTEDTVEPPDHNSLYTSVEQYLDTGTALDLDLMDTLIRPFWYYEPYRSSGVVIDGFPFRPCDIESMKHSVTIPDVIIELETSADQVQTRVFDEHFARWYSVLEEKRRIRNEENQKIVDAYNAKRDILFRNQFKMIKSTRKAEYVAALMALEELKPGTPNIEEEYIDVLDIMHSDKAGGGDTSKGKMEVILEATEDELKTLENERLESIREYREIDPEGEYFGGEEEPFDEHESVFEWDEMEDDILQLNERLDELFPKPEIDTSDDRWESEQSAKERVVQQIEDWFEIDMEFLTNIKEANEEEEPFEWIRIKTNNRPENNVLMELIFKLRTYKDRNLSFFERTYIISMERAETLIYNGYFLVSRFGRVCPVQLLEGENSIPMYIPSLMKNEVFPVIHRQYIYFISGKDNLIKFRSDPLTYLVHTNRNIPIYPLKIAIIGPPMCGKSTLVQRFAKEFAIKVITKEDAINYVVTDLPWTSLAQEIVSKKETGTFLRTSTVIKAVVAASLDPLCASQGYVLDGFPSSIEELMELVEGDVIPYVFIDLKTELNAMIDRNPDGSCTQLAITYDNWRRSSSEVRDYIKTEYQNLVDVDGSGSKWDVWVAARDIVWKAMKGIHAYCQGIDRNIPVSLEYLCISPVEFEQRQSDYKNYCPCCFALNSQSLVSSGNPPDKQGLVQYLDCYYWICPAHLQTFMDKPDMFLPPNNSTLPEDYPKRVKKGVKIKNLKDKIYENGIDIVVFIENLPGHVMQKGDLKFAIEYIGKIFYFISEENLNKFMQQPDLYATKTISFKDVPELEPIETSKLPIMGFLQQTQATLLTEAVTAVGRLRPKYPGLDCAVSASIYLGLYLKTHNPQITGESLEAYKMATQTLLGRYEWLTSTIDDFKKKTNPYLRMPSFLDQEQEC